MPEPFVGPFQNAIIAEQFHTCVTLAQVFLECVSSMLQS